MIGDYDFDEIEVIRNKVDKLSGTPAHSRTQKKQDKVLIYPKKRSNNSEEMS